MIYDIRMRVLRALYILTEIKAHGFFFCYAKAY